MSRLHGSSATDELVVRETEPQTEPQRGPESGSANDQMRGSEHPLVAVARGAFAVLSLPFVLARAVAGEWSASWGRQRIAGSWSDEQDMSRSMRLRGSSRSESIMTLPDKNALSRETATFARLLPDLRRSALGQFVLIDGTRLVGTFKSYDEAIAAGYAQFGLRPFFVQKVDEAMPPTGVRRIRFSRPILQR